MSTQKLLFPLLMEGKTKKIWSTADEDIVLIENKDYITADDGRRRDVFKNKAQLVTHITSNCFDLLHRAGIATHFLARENEVVFRAKKLDMIPIEIVVRRRAFGSYLERNPTTSKACRFTIPIVEFFQKSNFMHDPLLVVDHGTNTVQRYNSHMPLAQGFISECSPQVVESFALERWSEIETIARKAFETIEAAWASQHMTLADMKIECGIDIAGNLLVGDVIDNDSWRLWPEGDFTCAADKQRYIDGCPLDYVARLYSHVANMTDRFKKPGSNTFLN